MGKKVSSSSSIKKEVKSYKSDRVYWDERLPTVKGILKFDIKSVGLKKNDILNVQCDPCVGYDLRCRCEMQGYYFFITITDIHFEDDTPLKMMKEYRKKMIEKKLIEPIKDFDYGCNSTDIKKDLFQI